MARHEEGIHGGYCLPGEAHGEKEEEEEDDDALEESKPKRKRYVVKTHDRSWSMRVKNEHFQSVINLDTFYEEASGLLNRLKKVNNVATGEKEKRCSSPPPALERPTVQKMIIEEVSDSGGGGTPLHQVRTLEELTRDYTAGVNLQSLQNTEDNSFEGALQHANQLTTWHPVPRKQPTPDVGSGLDTVVGICFVQLREKTSLRRASKIVLELDAVRETTLEMCLEKAFQEGWLGFTRDYIVDMPHAVYGHPSTLEEMGELNIGTRPMYPLTTQLGDIPIRLGTQLYIRHLYGPPMGMIFSHVTHRSVADEMKKQAGPTTYPLIVSKWRALLKHQAMLCHACLEAFPSTVTEDTRDTLQNRYTQWCTRCLHFFHGPPKRARDGELIDIALPQGMKTYAFSKPGCTASPPLINNDGKNQPITTTTVPSTTNDQQPAPIRTKNDDALLHTSKSDGIAPMEEEEKSKNKNKNDDALFDWSAPLQELHEAVRLVNKPSVLINAVISDLPKEEGASIGSHPEPEHEPEEELEPTTDEEEGEEEEGDERMAEIREDARDLGGDNTGAKKTLDVALGMGPKGEDGRNQEDDDGWSMSSV